MLAWGEPTEPQASVGVTPGTRSPNQSEPSVCPEIEITRFFGTKKEKSSLKIEPSKRLTR